MKISGKQGNGRVRGLLTGLTLPEAGCAVSSCISGVSGKFDWVLLGAFGGVSRTGPSDAPSSGFWQRPREGFIG